MRKCITKKIRELRIKNKLTIQELAKKIGIPASTLGMYERGMRNPDIELVMKIATIFNVDIKFFYDENYMISEIINSIDEIGNNSEIIKARKRAGGFCELCRQMAPFFLQDGTPYLETHKIIIKENIEKVVMLCPNCKKKIEILKYIGDINYLKGIIEREMEDGK